MRKFVFIIFLFSGFICFSQGYIDDDFRYKKNIYSNNPHVLIETIEYFGKRLNTYLEGYKDEIETLEERISANYQNELLRVDEFEPKVWETNTEFADRKSRAKKLINDRIKTEIKLTKKEKQSEMENFLYDYLSYYSTADLRFNETSYFISNANTTIIPGKYLRNENSWDVTIYGTTEWGDKVKKKITINFFGEENKKDVINLFDTAIKNNAVAAALVCKTEKNTSEKGFSFRVEEVYLYHKDLFYPFYLSASEKLKKTVTYPVTAKEFLKQVTEEAPTVEAADYEDGIYFAQEDGFSEKTGWKYMVTLEVEDGEIVSAEWNGANVEGGLDKKTTDKMGMYNMVAFGGAQAEWYEQAEKAEQFLLENQDPTAITYSDDEGHTDDIAGVSIHVVEFFELAEKALAQGPSGLGPYEDGRYFAQAMEFAGSGWKSTVDLTVVSGRIVAAYWDAVNEAGENKKEVDAAGEYGMIEHGGAQSNWTVQENLMEQRLLEIQDPAAISVSEDGYADAISGVSIHIDDFVELAEKALNDGPDGKDSYYDGK